MNIKYIFFLGVLSILPGGFKNFYNSQFKIISVEQKTITVPADRPCFLVISDIHLDSEAASQAAIDRKSDSDSALWDSAKNTINKIIDNQRPGFMIVLGDLPFHADPDSPEQVRKARYNEGIVLKQLREISEKKNIPLLFVPGNNDSYTGDYHSFSNEIFAGDSIGKDYWPIINATTKNKFSDDPLVADASHAGLGYYAAYPLGKALPLRVIVMNTVMFNPQGWTAKDTIWNYNGNDSARRNNDAKQQMEWLSGQLRQAKDSNEKVIIAMHIPIGKNAHHENNKPIKDFWDSSLEFNNKSVKHIFLDLADSFKNNIIGILSSHTHMDGIRLLRSRSKDSISSLLISIPGIAPGHGNNPAVKLIYYNQGNLALEDFTTFYMNYQKGSPLTSWNSSFGFRELTGSRVSMLKYVRDKRNKERIKRFVEQTYSASSQKETDKNEDVENTIYVEYQE